MFFTPLNLPPAPLKLTRSNGVVHVQCLIRRKKLVLTPEEWVRQHVLYYMICHAGYPKERIAVEFALRYNGGIKRCDILVANEIGAPLLITECKAPEVSIDEKTLLQVAKYNHTLNASVFILTNGLVHFSFEKSDHASALAFKEHIVSWQELTGY